MPPASFQRSAPGRIEIREGGGCLAVFGLPFLIVGLASSAIGYAGLELQNYAIAPDTSQLGFMVIGSTFSLIGGALVFGRSWIMLSSADRTIVKRVGLLVPMTRRAYRVDNYSLVLLEFVRGDSDTSDSYPVSLKSRAGRNLRLFSSNQYAEARERATAVADLFNLQIEDSSTGHPVVRSAAQADMSLQHRQRIEHARDEMVVRPASMRSTVSESQGTITMVIPNMRVHPALFLVFFLPIIAPVMLVEPFLRFFQQSQTPNVVTWSFVGFLIIVFGVLPAYAGVSAFLKSRRGRITITASTAGVRIDERRVFRTRTLASYSAADILDVDYAPDQFASARATAGDVQAQRPAMAAPTVGMASERILRILRTLTRSGGITIVARQGQTTFAQGLDDREVRYLHYMVRQALSPKP
ncbi:MAG TPA: hypothetical protein VM115_02200 [Vicinamibacterales bacterium]|nr:hypothetical protein [Vicinamibacterales bacterium]